MDANRPLLLPATYHEKVWGRYRGGMKLGEIWCQAHPLLLKFIFSSEKLSVQVHPGDDYAAAHENSLGKTECWTILDAEPGARLAVGFEHEMSRDQIGEAIANKTIENDLAWIEVQPGDFIFVPWGTVHAIGAGVTLCEVQEFSDVTYRMYDYGRPRETHLEKGLEVIRRHPSAGLLRPVRLEVLEVASSLAPSSGAWVPHSLPDAPRFLRRVRQRVGGPAPKQTASRKAAVRRGGPHSKDLCASARHEMLVACRHFAIERFFGVGERTDSVDRSRSEVLIFLAGEGEIITGDARYPYKAEQMWQLPATLGGYRIVPGGQATWLKTYVPPSLSAVRARLAEAGVPESEINRIVIEDV